MARVIPACGQSMRGYRLKSLTGVVCFPAIACTTSCISRFYPFNGGKITKKKLKLYTQKLGPSGDHVGDWEVVGLRVLFRDGHVIITAIQSSRHMSSLSPIAVPEDANLDWVDDDGFVSPYGTHPVFYSAWGGHSLYPHAGCFQYAGQKVNLADIFSKAIKNLTSSVMKVLSKVPVIDARVWDFTEISPENSTWYTWRNIEFTGINNTANPKHRWWWSKNDWMWGNNKTGGVHFLSLTISDGVNRLLSELTVKACARLANNSVFVEVVCGLSEAPKSPLRQVHGLQRKFGLAPKCQPDLQWVMLEDLTTGPNKVKQCKDGPLKTHGSDDGKNILKPFK